MIGWKIIEILAYFFENLLYKKFEGQQHTGIDPEVENSLLIIRGIESAKPTYKFEAFWLADGSN